MEAADSAAESADQAVDNAEATVESADEAEVAEGTPVEGQIFEQSPDTFLASTLLDADVVNSADEKIGDVRDMVLTADGTVEGVVIGVGGFLGIGEKEVAIELSALSISEDENGDLNFMLNATEEELKAAPEFRDADEMENDREATAAAPATGTGGMGTGAGTTTTAPSN
nr:PRC-barrel domain-containing protein [Acuticoccus kalidii]